MRDQAAASTHPSERRNEAPDVVERGSAVSPRTPHPVESHTRRSPVAVLLTLAFLSFAARIASLVFQGPGLSEVGFPDERNYYLSAAAFMKEHGILQFFRTDRSLWNGPLNPLWVYLWNSNIPALKLANNALVSFTGLLIWEIARRNNAGRFAYLGAMIFLFFPPWFVFGPSLLTEPPFVFLLTSGLWLAGRSSTTSPFIGGVVFGLATLVRPTTQLFFLAIGGLWLVSFAIPRFADRNVRSRLLLFAAGSVLLPGYWIAQNFFVFGEPKIANGFGAVLYLGNDLRKNGDEPIYTAQQFDTFELTKPYAHLDSPGDRILADEAKRMIAEHPKDAVLLTLRKSLRYMFGNSDAYFYPFRSLLPSWSGRSVSESLFATVWLCLNSLIVVSGLLALLFVVPTRRSLDLALLGALAVYLVALHAISFPIPRLQLPAFAAWCSLASVGFASTAWFRRISGSIAGAVIAFIAFSGDTSSALSAEAKRRFTKELVRVPSDQQPFLNDLISTSEGLRITGKDPYLIFPIRPLQLRNNIHLFVELRSECGAGAPSSSGQFQFFEKLSELPWSESNSHFREGFLDTRQLFDVTLGNSESEQGKSLEAVRVDLPANADGCVFSMPEVILAK